MGPIRRAALWLSWHAPLGRLNPWLYGFAIRRRPHKVHR